MKNIFRPQKILIIAADSPQDAIADLPRCGTNWPAEHGRPQLIVESYEIASIPRSLFAWLFRKPPLWQVVATLRAGVEPESTSP